MARKPIGLAGRVVRDALAKKSDANLRGAFVPLIREVLRLREPVETLTATRSISDVEVDWAAHDTRVHRLDPKSKSN